ncbi:hypothetical protein [Deinococcus geothermalis]|uniref:hypothetical protein n=1 Tax=Deinococcus geothermalis TaxID=68909 RepID=UPI000322B69D|nr:hypothetical protein [Deinococcus geothermalis]
MLNPSAQPEQASRVKLAGVPDVADFSWVGPTFFGPLVFMDAVWAGAALYAGPHER